MCEGCGDCSVKSNCLSVEPLETEFGTQAPDQPVVVQQGSSCVNGFCPSLSPPKGRRWQARAAWRAMDSLPALPEPVLPAIRRAYGIL
ncbi:hypothetical protein ACTMU2_35240 [Cupriavidus basilensis]